MNAISASLPQGLPANTSAPYVGAYINLDRSPERRQEMEAQYTTLGLADRYTRFRAVDGSTLGYKGPLRPGEAGSFMSHFRALEALRGTGKSIHVMEDDAIMSRAMAPMIEFAIAQGIFNHYDVVFTELYVLFEYLSSIRYHKQLYDDFLVRSQTDFQRSFKVLNLEGQTFYGLTSYVVGANSIDRTLSLWAQEAARGPTMANDVFMCRMCNERKLRIGYLFPFVTSIHLERALETTFRGRSTDAYEMVTLGSNLIRYSFYVESDLAGYAAPLLDRATAECVTRQRDPHQDFITRAMDYVVMIDEPSLKSGQ